MSFAPTRAIFIPRTTVKGRRGLAPLRSPFHRAARYGTFGSFRPAGAADQIPPHALAEPPRRRSCRSSASAPLPTKRPLSNFPAGPQNLVHFGAVQLRGFRQIQLCPFAARGALRAATAPPINMAFTLFAHHAEGGASSPFYVAIRYVAIRLPDHSAMITSNCRAHGLHHFVFSHDLIQKVGNFLGSCRREAACPQQS